MGKGTHPSSRGGGGRKRGGEVDLSPNASNSRLGRLERNENLRRASSPGGKEKKAKTLLRDAALPNDKNGEGRVSSIL